MIPRSPFARRLWAAAAVLAASALSVKVVRGNQKPYSPVAPAYREQGVSGAPLVIVEYSDFQCPACRHAVEPAKNLLSLYGNRTHFIFKHFPLRQHLLAQPAAIAAECAGRQGRFWEFHDLLYGKQTDWAPENRGPQPSNLLPVADRSFIAFATGLRMDLAAFAACRKDRATAALVARDVKDGDDHWVLSTPTFFINGKRFVGARQLADQGIIWIDKTLRQK